MNKNIIILIGQGKSTLTRFFINEDMFSMPNRKLGQAYLHELSIFDYIMIDDLDGILKNLDIIKKINDRESTQKIIVHLQSESDIKEIPLSIKNRALIFNLSI